MFFEERNLEFKDMEKINAELERIRDEWEKFAEEMANDDITPIHPPPALRAWFMQLFAMMDPTDIPEGVELGEWLVLRDMVLMDGTYRFAQWTMWKAMINPSYEPLMHRYLTPCKCGTVTDSQIKAFLKRGGEK